MEKNKRREREREGVCERDSKFCGKLVTAQGNKVNAKNNPGAHFPVNVWSRSTLTHAQTQTHTHTHTHTHTQKHHTSLMLQNPNPSSQLPENMTWPFRFTEHQAWAGLACFPSHRTPCLFRPPCNPQGPQLTTNNYSPSSPLSARHGQKNLTLHLTHPCVHIL